MKNFTRKVFLVIKETLDGWSEIRGSLLAAGIAYYAIFSLAPLFVVAISIAGLVFGEVEARGQLVEAIEKSVSPQVATTVDFLIAHANRTPPSSVTTWISLLITLISSSIMFVQLKFAINLMWGITPLPGKGLIILLRTQFLSFVFVLVIGLFLLASMVISTGLIFLEEHLGFLPDFSETGFPKLDFWVTFVVFTFFIALLYKFLPDAHLAWQDVLIGSAVTSLLFTAGEFLIGYYVGTRNLESVYGIAGSVILVLVWIYYSMEIILLGAKFTEVLANNHGKKVLPSGRAELVKRQRVNHLND